MPSKTELVSRRHELTHFSCGNPVLDQWLKKWAIINVANNSARTYVTHIDGRVVGYYSICTGSILREEAPERIAKGLAAHPVPIILLARLAVDETCQGIGLGAALLKDALARISGAADIAAARAVLVHAIDDSARSFYEYFDFEQCPTNEYSLMLLMQDIRSVLG